MRNMYAFDFFQILVNHVSYTEVLLEWNACFEVLQDLDFVIDSYFAKNGYLSAVCVLFWHFITDPDIADGIFTFNSLTSNIATVCIMVPGAVLASMLNHTSIWEQVHQLCRFLSGQIC